MNIRSKLYLTGYEQETIEEFINKLLAAKIDTIIDVREVPLSRKNGFSKKNLQKILKEKGINYLHFQELGSPSKIRSELKADGDYLAFFKAYRKHTKKKSNIIKDLLHIVNSKKHSALLCFEKDCQLCHRSILASELIHLNPHLQVIPL